MMKKLLLIFFFLLLGSGWAGATYPSYTVCPSSCDFNTLQGAVADLEANHATPSTPVTITISGSWSSADTTSVNITGINTTATNTLTITATGSARHNGQWTENGYYIYQTNYASGGLTISNDYVIIDGLQFYEYNTFTYSDAGSIIGGSTDANYHVTFKNNIVKSNRTGSNSNPIMGFSDTYYVTMYNNLIYEVGNKVATAYSSAGVDVQKPVYLYNNTFYGFNVGISSGAAAQPPMYLYNNLCNNNNTDYQLYSSTVTSSNNISQDTSSPDAAYQSKTVTFVNAGSYNFNLSGSDTAAKGNGANESGVFTTDITGATRSVPWDIGAFKAASTAVNHGFTRFLN